MEGLDGARQAGQRARTAGWRGGMGEVVPDRVCGDARGGGGAWSGWGTKPRFILLGTSPRMCTGGAAMPEAVGPTVMVVASSALRCRARSTAS